VSGAQPFDGAVAFGELFPRDDCADRLGKIRPPHGGSGRGGSNIRAGKGFEDRRDTALILLLVDVGPRRAS